MRLSKRLAQSGVAARRKADLLIQKGAVCVNGKVVKLPQTQVEATDSITIEGKPLSAQKKIYLIMHKPKGIECTHKKAPGKKIIYDLFKEVGARLFTIGRLDKDTTGLILLTNDGDFANKVIHPSSNITKEYLVKVNKDITHEHLVSISEGCTISGTLVKPKKVKKVRLSTLKITVSEGKNREVRRLMESAGLDVLELTRIRIGGLNLGNLPYGSYRILRDKEMKALFG